MYNNVIKCVISYSDGVYSLRYATANDTEYVLVDEALVKEYFELMYQFNKLQFVIRNLDESEKRKDGE